MPVSVTTKGKPKISEQIDPQLLSSLYANYKNSIEAILELIDNAVDDRIKEKQLLITITTSRGVLRIVNKGGLGMGLEELSDFFKWGRSNKRGKLGRYGQGGKAAMGYLGSRFKIFSTKINSGVRYSIRENNWDDRRSGLKEYAPEQTPTEMTDEGIVQIEVSKLKRALKKEKLLSAISKTYTPLIKSEQIKVTLDGRQVKPYVINASNISKFRRYLPTVGLIRGWAGFKASGSDIKGGIRCYAYGRLVCESEFFGHKEKTFKASLNRLVGELFLEDIPLTMNKTDFDRGSTSWSEVKEAMFGILKPFVKKLLEEKQEETPSDEEILQAMLAKDLIFDALKNLSLNDKLEGETFGQKKPQVQVATAVQREEVNSPPGSRAPQTPPPSDAIGRRKRTKGVIDFDVRYLVDSSIRSQIVEEERGKILIINSNFPAFGLSRLDLLYKIETAIFELMKPEEDENPSVEEYFEEANKLFKQVCDLINHKKINRFEHIK